MSNEVTRCPDFENLRFSMQNRSPVPFDYREGTDGVLEYAVIDSLEYVRDNTYIVVWAVRGSKGWTRRATIDVVKRTGSLETIPPENT